MFILVHHLHLVALILLVHPSPHHSFTSCAPSRYGHRCESLCSCTPTEDCNDGVRGTGDCTPILDIKDLPDDTLRRHRLINTSPFLASFDLLPTSISKMTVSKDTRRASRQVFGSSAARILPLPFKSQSLDLVALNLRVASHLGLQVPSTLTPAHRVDLAEVFSGRVLLPGSQTFAHAYSGHQFGSWAGQLGDGRAITIGDRLSPKDGAHYEISLKGSGRTAFSRAGDGRAVLRNLCREYLASAYLHALGVPTTTSLALIGSDVAKDGIVRDEFYERKPIQVRPGVLVRVSPSFVRFGSFQHAAKRQGYSGVLALARQVLDVVREQESVGDQSWHHHFKRLPLSKSIDKKVAENCFSSPMRVQSSCSLTTDKETDEREMLRCFFERTVQRVASLIAAWQSIGFAHGVMNTDNMAASGITIDLNVFGLILGFERQGSEFTPNYIDDDQRYKFGNQAKIAQWNLRRLGDVLQGKTTFVGGDRDSPRGGEKEIKISEAWLSEEDIEETLENFNEQYQFCYEQRMRWRMGFADLSDASDASDASAKAVALWMEWMEAVDADYHLASRALAELGEKGEAVRVTSFLANARAAGGATGGAAGGGRNDGTSIVRQHDEQLKAALDAVRTAVQHEYGDDWIEWQQHVRRVTPRYIMRTAALREIGDIVDGGDSSALRIAHRYLSNPFRDEYEYGGGGGGEEDALEKYVRTQLERLPTLKEKGMKTSCGGQ